MQASLFVILGASLGALLRWQLGIYTQIFFNGTIPYATVIANGLSAFIAGILLAIQVYSALPETWRLFGLVGFCGALSTFSTFSLEGFLLLQQEKWGLFGLHAMTHFLISLAMLALGYFVTKGLKPYF